ncbi:hypothetical protein PsorP6_013321 [Peronosclerospora sorghi]|uniref:Uncharacterized protein n=1 Tax=Peronosclerospora sorghi TaxID=230839 RepID=A0ACC0WIP5_9STRA|nr:hypothetical protein PsorP6_013321 [Peronosclerospora sorghi]
MGKHSGSRASKRALNMMNATLVMDRKNDTIAAVGAEAGRRPYGRKSWPWRRGARGLEGTPPSLVKGFESPPLESWTLVRILSPVRIFVAGFGSPRWRTRHVRRPLQQHSHAAPSHRGVCLQAVMSRLHPEVVRFVSLQQARVEAARVFAFLPEPPRDHATRLVVALEGLAAHLLAQSLAVLCLGPQAPRCRVDVRHEMHELGGPTRVHFTDAHVPRVDRKAPGPRASLDQRFQHEDLSEHDEETDGPLRIIELKLLGDDSVREKNDRAAMEAYSQGRERARTTQSSGAIAPSVLSSSKRWQGLGTLHTTVRSFLRRRRPKKTFAVKECGTRCVGKKKSMCTTETACTRESNDKRRPRRASVIIIGLQRSREDPRPLEGTKDGIERLRVAANALLDVIDSIGTLRHATRAVQELVTRAITNLRLAGEAGVA